MGKQKSVTEDTLDTESFGQLSKKSPNLISVDSFKKIWNDPVFSRVIAAGILLLLPLFTAVILKFIQNETFWNSLKSIMNLKLTLWTVLLGILLIVILLIVFKRLRNWLLKPKYYFPYTAQIGSFSFYELYNCLASTKFKLIPELSMHTGLQEIDLLRLFIFYSPMLNKGVDWDFPGSQGTYVYYKLGPKLMSYGICEKVKSLKRINKDNMNHTIQTSEVGYKFLAYVEKYKFFIESTGQAETTGKL